MDTNIYYMYKPIKSDKDNPSVQYGDPIKEGTKVYIREYPVDPERSCVYIADPKTGDAAIVYKESLIPLTD